MHRFLLLGLCAALAGSSCAPAADPAEILVDALGCEVPVSTRYHVETYRDGVIFKIPRTPGTQIWIGPIDEHTAKPIDSQYQGALKVARYAPGCMSISPRPWVAVQGLHQEVDLIGLTDPEVKHVIEHCNATMNPQVIAIAARMAKGCAAVVPTEEAKEALLGKVGLTRIIDWPQTKQRTPWRSSSWQVYQPEGSPNLSAQHVRRGARVISICGVPVSEIEEGGPSLCCGTPIDGHIEAIIVEDGKSRTITGAAPAAVTADVPPAKAPGSGCGS